MIQTASQSIRAGRVGKPLVKLKRVSATTTEHVNLAKARGCPINGRVPTTIAKSTFKAMCLKHQNRTKSVLNSSMNTTTGFVTNNKTMCVDCKIGAQVASNTPFKAPYNMTFKNLKR